MRAKAMVGKRSIKTSDVVGRKASGELTVDVREIDDVESLALGLRMSMFEFGEGDEKGSLSTGSGLGTDFIIMEWRGRGALVRGIDLFRAWVATFAPEDAARMSELGG